MSISKFTFIVAALLAGLVIFKHRKVSHKTIPTTGEVAADDLTPAPEPEKEYAQNPVQATASVPAAPNEALIAQVKQKADLENFKQIEACVERRDHCGIADTNPYAVFDGVVTRINESLVDLRRQYATMSDAERAAVAPQMTALTHWALQFDDDNVREQGLALAQSVLPPEERIDAVISSLQDSVSGPLYGQGLHILEQAIGNSRNRQIEKFAVQTILNGGLSTAEEFVHHPSLFLHPENLSYFKNEVLPRLAPDSNLHMLLEQQIREKELLWSHG